MFKEATVITDFYAVFVFGMLIGLIAGVVAGWSAAQARPGTKRPVI
jgi:hypothetical protein